MPALGKDLSKIRSHLDLSIQDVQHVTKIPVTTLKSIEDGSIFNHPEENQTYIRSFVRSYGRALKIDDDVMIKALDQNEAGNYNHLLLQDFPALNPEKPAPTESETEQPSELEEKAGTDDTSVEEEFAFEENTSVEDEPRQEPSKQEQEEEPEVAEAATPQKDVKPIKTDSSPSVKSVDWANVGRKFSQEKKHTPVWIIGLIIILIIAAFVTYFLYENGFFNLSDLSPQEQEQVTPENTASQSNLSLDLEDSLAVTQTPTETETPAETAVELDDVLQLTVYAAYDGLGPVRVWSDMKPRMDPYWLEQGTAMHFEFRDTIRIRGAYEDLLLFKDGNRVENAAQEFLQQEPNYIEITRNFFQSDEKWSTAVNYELPENTSPPDSIANSPTF